MQVAPTVAAAAAVTAAAAASASDAGSWEGGGAGARGRYCAAGASNEAWPDTPSIWTCKPVAAPMRTHANGPGFTIGGKVIAQPRRRRVGRLRFCPGAPRLMVPPTARLAKRSPPRGRQQSTWRQPALAMEQIVLRAYVLLHACLFISIGRARVPRAGTLFWRRLPRSSIAVRQALAVRINDVRSRSLPEGYFILGYRVSLPHRTAARGSLSRQPHPRRAE